MTQKDLCASSVVHFPLQRSHRACYALAYPRGNLGFLYVGNRQACFCEQKGHNMVPFRADITINRPVEEVFDFVANPQNYPKWMGGVSRAETISKEMGNGTQVRMAGRFGFWNVDAPFEITHYEPNHAFGMKGAAGPFWFEGKWNFERVGDSATRLSVAGEYRMSGVWRLAEPLFAGEVQNGEAKELTKIKSSLENIT